MNAMPSEDVEEPAGPPVRPPDRVLSINQLVSYNLMRARRLRAWTQQDVAELLERYTGRPWSNASVSAAERAWQGGRPRRFDASEIVALCKIFDVPVGYFFLPSEDSYLSKWVGMQEFPEGQPIVDPDNQNHDLMALIPTADLVQMVGVTAEDSAQAAEFQWRMQNLSLRWLGLVWESPRWRMALHEIRSTKELQEEYETDWSEVMGSRTTSEEILGISTDKAPAPFTEAYARHIAREVVRVMEEKGLATKHPGTEDRGEHGASDHNPEIPPPPF